VKLTPADAKFWCNLLDSLKHEKREKNHKEGRKE
jgi:hypothetical protein